VSRRRELQREVADDDDDDDDDERSLENLKKMLV
jgi:hypothetical protein